MSSFLNKYSLAIKCFYNLNMLEASPEKIKKIQFKRLKKICFHAYDNLMFYQHLWCKNDFQPEQLKCNEDIQKIPITTKRDLKDYFPEFFLSRKHKASDCRILSSSGSTGSPTRIFVGKEKIINEISIFSNYFISKFSNIKIKNPIFIVENSQDSFEAQAGKMFKSKEDNFVSITEPIPKIIDKILNKYDSIITYSSIMTQLCNYCIENKINIKNKISSVFLSGEAVTENVRTLIKEVFQCPAIEAYASTEAGFMSCENSEGLVNLAWKNIIEILSENNMPVQPGESGEIVVTDLTNFATPLIRYNGVGDRARLKSYQSKLGGIVIEKIEGRVADIIKLKSGKIINPFLLISVIEVIPAVTQFQIIQQNIDLFCIKIIPLVEREIDRNKIVESFKFGKYFEEIQTKMTEIMGDNNKIIIEIVKSLENKNSHKTPLIIAYKEKDNIEESSYLSAA